jgi:hypothetical protein
MGEARLADWSARPRYGNLTQGNAIDGLRYGYRLHRRASCNGFAVGDALVESGGTNEVPHQGQNR